MTLNVYFGIKKCGILSTTDDRGIVFKYDEAYLSSNSAQAISLSLPLQKSEFTQKRCLLFFSGLIPEEFTRKRVADYLHISELSTIKLLDALGRECAGYLSIADDSFDSSTLREEYDINSDHYEKISQKQLEDYVRNIPQRPFIKADDKLRLSLAGAQEKLSLAFFNNQWYLPLNGVPSTHILKPTRDGGLESLAKNEYKCMLLAKECGLDVPNVRLKNIAGKDVFIVERYDRIINGDKIRRLHQEDMCQALGIMPDRKYQADGGPSIKDIYELIKEKSILPVVDLRAFLSNVIFNYLVGNCDAHSKNYSILYDERGKVRISPLYDVVSTTVYPSLTKKMSMKIGRHYELNKIDEEDFSLLADDLNINKTVIANLLFTIKRKIQNSKILISQY